MTWMMRGLSSWGEPAAKPPLVVPLLAKPEPRRKIGTFGSLVIFPNWWWGFGWVTMTVAGLGGLAALLPIPGGQFVSQLLEELPVEEFPPLPQLAGREGSIEAEPFKPGRVTASTASNDDDRDEDSGVAETVEDNSPAPVVNSSDSGTSGSSGSSDSGSSGSSSGSNSGGQTAPPPAGNDDGGEPASGDPGGDTEDPKPPAPAPVPPKPDPVPALPEPIAPPSQPAPPAPPPEPGPVPE
jgi:penicillin-binding protein 1A